MFNGVTFNGVTFNGVTFNGVTFNGVTFNGVTFNGVNSLTSFKCIYRLNKCGELCLGIFCTVVPDSGVKAETLATGKPVGNEQGKRSY